MTPLKGHPMTSRRQALALAGALTLTVFTAVGAIAGINHRPAIASPTSTPAAAQIMQAQAPASGHTWRDD
jgi:hypothetical protein